MRYKEPFTIYPRKLKNVTVFYYQCHDKNGKRICGHSTGQRTKTAARWYCMELFREGKLIPEKKSENESVSFGEFAEGWWNHKTCKYLEWRQVQNPLAPSTISHYRANLELHIRPYFGNIQLSAIMPESILNWLMYLSRKGYDNSTINIQLATLKVMMKEAVRQRLIPNNPAEQIKKLTVHNKEVQILKKEEVQRIFPADWRLIWDSHHAYLFNKLAACTGMRLSEIMGLQKKHIHEDYIHVCVQHSTEYGIRPLKTKDSRNIPIPSALRSELSVLIEKNADGFVFSDTGGGEPISRTRLYRETGNAFDKIGINREERLRRGIALHHWRHFLNTALIMANVSTLKVQKVTGHKSLAMTRHYTHFDCRDFSEVVDVQNSLMAASSNTRHLLLN